MIVKLIRVNDGFDDIALPSYETNGSAGMDIRAALNESIIISPGKMGLIPTNLSVEIPEGYEIQVRPRSGLAIKNGIGILNSPGTIDSDYRGEIKIIIINLGESDFTIKRGDRIAQIILNKVEKIDWQLTHTLSETARGENGFGSTNTN
ncbi:MAG TPA: dUTP diphosphatase [Ignavibacteriaceae bacterium]|nr:dUTP diphosphatase [Ignavibacteriaceae bacterium]